MHKLRRSLKASPLLLLVLFAGIGIARAEAPTEICGSLFKTPFDQAFCKEILDQQSFSPDTVSRCAHSDPYATLDCLSEQAHLEKLKADASPEARQLCSFSQDQDTELCLRMVSGKRFGSLAELQKCRNTDPLATARCLQNAAL